MKNLKREADIQFLRKWSMYHLPPKSVRFKQHKEENSSRRATTFRYQVISAKIDRQQKSLKVKQISFKKHTVSANFLAYSNLGVKISAETSQG